MLNSLRIVEKSLQGKMFFFSLNKQKINKVTFVDQYLVIKLHFINHIYYIHKVRNLIIVSF